jgi:hypothetical protein
MNPYGTARKPLLDEVVERVRFDIADDSRDLPSLAIRPHLTLKFYTQCRRVTHLMGRRARKVRRPVSLADPTRPEAREV